MKSTTGRILREPLLHFAGLGLMLFLLGMLSENNTALNTTIVIDDNIHNRLSNLYRNQMGEAPSAAVLDTLIDNYVRDEVLYREALAMNLEQDDEIVRRRMIQKLEYLLSATSRTRVPDESELQAWFEQHPEQFMLPAQVSFNHRYFSPDRDNLEQARQRASNSLTLLNTGSHSDLEQADTLTDPFMLQTAYHDMSSQHARQLFGDTEFSSALFTAAPGYWTGPLASGYGWHLLFIQERKDPRLPAFSTIRQQILAAFQEDQQSEQAAEQFRLISGKYHITGKNNHE